MSVIQLGLVLPTELHDKRNRLTLVEDLSRALDLITGHFDSAWMVDHLQFGDTDVLEGFTALTYLSTLHPSLKFGNACYPNRSVTQPCLLKWRRRSS